MVVMPGHDGQEAVERDPAVDWVGTALFPTRRSEGDVTGRRATVTDMILRYVDSRS
jgi:hypothetical protein